MGQEDTRVRDVCVIGAGSSGITAIKTLVQAGVDVTAFEASDRIGGNWAFGNSNGRSAAYRSLHMNTSRERMQYSDFPMRRSVPDFPRHDQVLAYFEDYARHFGVHDHVRFQTTVERVAPRADGTFLVATTDGQERSFAAVVVANGHHWSPRWPEPAPPGLDSFDGEVMHAHDYRGIEQLRDKRIVVVGLGNSATDIAVDASYVAASTTLSARRGAHIIPKYVFGRPFDQLASSPLITDRMRWIIARRVIAAVTGPMTRYGLPAPDHRLADAHPTVSNRILDRLAHQAVAVRPGISRLDGDEVVFTDGSRTAADLVAFCTGYKIAFPFFDPTFLDPSEDNRVRLYKRIFHPHFPRVSFVGLIQPLGAVMPIAERQSQLIAAELTGRYRLPAARAREREIDAYERQLRQRFVSSKRHTIEVDFDDHLRELSRELRRGASRARRAAHAGH